MRCAALGLWLAISGLACARDSEPPHGARERAEGQPDRVEPSASPALHPVVPASSAPPAQEPPQNAAPKPFVPADIPPPHARSAVAGDGHWKALAGKGAGAEVMYTTLLHPHEASSFITLTLVAIDLEKARLHFLPGVDDVGKTTVPFAPGLVPENEQDRLLAVFNGGFMPRHGRWGMRVGETTILPPRDPGCTVALLADGNVRIRSWPALASSNTDIRALRQTPPCLVEQGAIHPDLTQNRDKVWAGQTPGIVTRRRSAIGLSQDGKVLYYAVGVETPPKLLAQGLLAAGIHDAAQLDINWNWTRFFVFGRGDEGKLRVTSTLVDVEHSKIEYVERASERDFFYLLKRPEAK